MKRVIPLLLAAMMLLTLIACTANVDEPVVTSSSQGGNASGDPGSNTGNTGNTGGDPSSDPGQSTDTTQPAPEGFVVDESQIRGRTIRLFYQSEGARTRQYMEEFSKLYDCDFELIIAPWPSDAARLISLIMSGDSPDVIDLNDEYLPLYAIRKICEPIDGYFDPNSPYIDRGIMDGMKYNGKTYILHSSIRSPVMVFYNKSMFDRYGEDTPMDYYDRGEWTIDKLYEVAQIFNDDTDNDGVLDQFGFIGTSVYEFLGANQLPLAAYDPGTSKFSLALGEQKQQDVLQDALDHITAGDIQPFAWTAQALFPSGKVAMAGYEEWFNTSLVNMEDEWSVAPYPTGKYGDADYKYVRPFGVGVAAGAANGYAGMQFALYTYMRDEELRNEQVAPWTGERWEAREKARDKESYFSLHIGIPNFRTAVDAINYGMADTGGKPFSALFEERRTELEGLIGDINSIQEGWVEPKQFVYQGPVDFESGMGYLQMGTAEQVTQEIVDNGIDGKSLKITIVDPEAGWYPIFGSTVDSVSLAGGQMEYIISFDYEVISAVDSYKPAFNTIVYPGDTGWSELAVKQGDKGHAEIVMRLYDDRPDLYFAVCFVGGTEVLIDNFDIVKN